MFRNPPMTPRFRAAWAQRQENATPAPDLPPESSVEYTIGLDLGKLQDYSALCVIERTAPPAGKATYAVRHLRRWPLGTNYTIVAADVAELAYRPELNLPRIAADATGVGTAVMEMIEQSLRAKAGDGRQVDLWPVLIGGGHSVRCDSKLTWHVAKAQLVSVLRALLSGRRLKIANELAEAAILFAELKAFSVKLTQAGNERFEAWRERDHDDLVLAVAMALWLAENGPRGRFEIY
jgi:hypothetical protein